MPTPIRSDSPHVSSDHSLRQSLEDDAASPRSLGGRAFPASRDERFLNLPSVRTGTSQSSTPSSAFSRLRRPSLDKQGLFDALANLLASSASTRGNLREAEHYNRSSQPVWPPSAGLRMQYPAVIAANDRDIMVQGADGRTRRFPIDNGPPEGATPASRQTPVMPAIGRRLASQLDAIYDAHVNAIHSTEA
jgi:hypothetical protein